MDSITDQDLDRVFIRISKEIDMSKVKDRDDLRNASVPLDPRLSNLPSDAWRDLFGRLRGAQIASQSRQVKLREVTPDNADEAIDFFKEKAVEQGKSQTIAENSSTRYEVSFHKDNTTQTIARDKSTGRFKSVSKSALTRTLRGDL